MRYPRIVADLHRKVGALPGGLPGAAEPALAVCARERVLDLPEDVRAVTAADIFG